MEETGFHAGNAVLVKCENSKPVIAQGRAETIEAEKAFMGEQTKRSQKKFLKEKEDLHTHLVEERKEEYGRANTLLRWYETSGSMINGG